MNDQEINRAVAESVGFNWWAVEKGGWYYRKGGGGYTNRIEEAGRYTEADARKELVRGEPMGVHAIPPPDYCNDLNAMHEVENRLTDDEHLRFRNALWLLIIKTTQLQHHVSRNVHSAKARQRAQAYLRTIGKWRDA